MTVEEKLIRENAVLRDRCFVMGKGFMCDWCTFDCIHKPKPTTVDKTLVQRMYNMVWVTDSKEEVISWEDIKAFF